MFITRKNILVISSKISRIIKGHQFVIKCNVICLWGDNFISRAYEDNWKIILLGVIDNNITSSLGEEDYRT